MSDSRNGTNPQAPVESIPRHSYTDRLAGREEPPKPQVKRRRRSIRVTILLIVLIPLGAVGGACYYAQSQSCQSTDDAFIDGHIINVAPQVAGRVDRVLVDDNQVVKKGDLVVVLDNRNFVATSNQKVAALDNVRAQEVAVKASIEQAIAHVKSLQATVESDQAAADASRAQADKAGKDFQRSAELFRNRVVSAQDEDAARATNDSDQAQLQANQKKVVSDLAQVAEARATVNTFLALQKGAQAQIEEGTANLQAARLNESYTEIRAPEDGRITQKAIEPGDYVQTGQTLFALVPDNVWVTANYKEDQIGLMRPGQTVQIVIDAVHGQTFRGHVDMRVLLNRNLAIGAVVIFVAGGIMNGTTAILPQFLQNLMNYTALQAGLVISARGLGAIAGTLLAGRIMSKLDGRAFIAQGALLLALSMYWLGSINLFIGPGNLLWPIIVSGFAVAAIFVAITTFSVATVSRQQMGDATGLTSLLRNLGASVGISMLTNLVTRGTQAHQALMVGHLTPYATPFRNQVAALRHYLAAQGGGPAAAQHQAYGLIYQKLQQQASLWAYVDQFRLLALACAMLVPLVFLFQKSSQPLPEGAPMGH